MECGIRENNNDPVARAMEIPSPYLASRSNLRLKLLRIISQQLILELGMREKIMYEICKLQELTAVFSTCGHRLHLATHPRSPVWPLFSSTISYAQYSTIRLQVDKIILLETLLSGVVPRLQFEVFYIPLQVLPDTVNMVPVSS